MSFRKEYKFRLVKSEAISIKADLLAQGMEILYPKRLVSSIYFDDQYYSLHAASEEGSLPRYKVRLRSYPEEDPDRITLETKISSIEGRFKSAKPINTVDASKLLREGYFLHSAGLLKPKCTVSYYREYYTFENMRITFDSDIKYLSQNKPLMYMEPEVVVEIKVHNTFDHRIIEKYFPNTTSRFSKYSRAIGRTCINNDV